jgi:hypothetical protein
LNENPPDKADANSQINCSDYQHPVDTAAKSLPFLLKLKNKAESNALFMETKAENSNRKAGFCLSK